MADTFHLSIVTPEGTLADEDVAELVGPGWLGEFGVRPGHRPMVIALRPGVVRFSRAAGGAPERIAVGGGFAVVDQTSATVLADAATPAADVDVAKAQQAADLAERQMQGLGIDSPDYERLTLVRGRALAQVAAAQSR